jgi:hypothetical protein
VENRFNTLPTEMLLKIADALATTASYLLMGNPADDTKFASIRLFRRFQALESTGRGRPRSHNQGHRRHGRQTSHKANRRGYQQLIRAHPESVRLRRRMLLRLSAVAEADIDHPPTPHPCCHRPGHP